MRCIGYTIIKWSDRAYHNGGNSDCQIRSTQENSIASRGMMAANVIGMSSIDKTNELAWLVPNGEVRGMSLGLVLVPAAWQFDIYDLVLSEI